MSDNIDFDKFLLEINQLGEKLTQVKSKTGLIMHQNTIQDLYEKFIFFKVSHLKNVTFKEEDLKVNHLEEKKEVKIDVVEPKEEKAESLSDKVKPVEKKEIENLNLDVVKIEKEVNPLVQNPVNKSVISKFQIKKEEEVLVDDSPISKVKNINLNSQKEISDIKLNINDRIAFINQLFEGEYKKCIAAIDAFNQIENKKDSITLFNQLSEKFNWKGKEEYSERLKELIDNRFN